MAWDLSLLEGNLDDDQKQQLNESKKVNEILVKKHGWLGALNERVIYDKKFLLEVAAAGYNPLDSEDVENYANNLPAKNMERNLRLAGVEEFKYLGQGEYEEMDLAKMVKKNNIEITVKKTDDVYISDLKGKQRESLMESMGEIDMDLSDIQVETPNTIKFKNQNEADDLLRKNLAKAFGSDDMVVKRPDLIIENKNKEIVKSNSNIEKTLELIKELRALGFTDSEIKEEIKNRY